FGAQRSRPGARHGCARRPSREPPGAAALGRRIHPADRAPPLRLPPGARLPRGRGRGRPAAAARSGEGAHPARGHGRTDAAGGGNGRARSPGPRRALAARRPAGLAGVPCRRAPAPRAAAGLSVRAPAVLARRPGRAATARRAGRRLRERSMTVERPDARRGMATFLVVWTGQVVSVLGSYLTGFALAVWIYQQTGSATYFALITLVTTLPGMLVLPLAGALVDRWDRR